MPEMTIKWITAEEAKATGAKEKLVLLEKTPYFRLAFSKFLTKEMDRAGSDCFFRGPSGMGYRLARLTDGPNGVEGIAIHLLGTAGTGTLRGRVDMDIWAFLEWLIDGVGGEWNIAALSKQMLSTSHPRHRNRSRFCRIADGYVHS
jgi:hypothetical protein